MSQIKIHFSNVQSANDSLSRTVRRLDDINSALTSLQRQLDSEITSRHQIGEKLRSAQKEAASIHRKAKKLYTATKKGVQTYQEMEANLRRKAPDNDTVNI